MNCFSASVQSDAVIVINRKKCNIYEKMLFLTVENMYVLILLCEKFSQYSTTIIKFIPGSNEFETW